MVADPAAAAAVQGEEMAVVGAAVVVGDRSEVMTSASVLVCTLDVLAVSADVKPVEAAVVVEHEEETAEIAVAEKDAAADPHSDCRSVDWGHKQSRSVVAAE